MMAYTAIARGDIILIGVAGEKQERSERRIYR